MGLSCVFLFVYLFCAGDVMSRDVVKGGDIFLIWGCSRMSVLWCCISSISEKSVCLSLFVVCFLSERTFTGF